MIRKYFLLSLVALSGVCFIGRLFFLQILNPKSNSLSDDNAIRKIFKYPKRGHIYDRNNKLLVANQPTYDIMIVPNEVENIDTLLFCKYLNINKDDFKKSFARAVRYSKRLPSLFLSHVSKKDYALFSEKLRKFKGFYIRKRSVREYQTEIGANILGYIAEVNPDNLNKDSYYKFGDLIGKLGVEKSYETVLRGKKGVNFIQKDIYNRDIGPYKDGVYDTLPIPGKDIVITIDSELQAYGESLMKNKMGAVVAIDPKSGELLSLVSAPSYNPALFVGRNRSKNYMMLYKDTIHKPLFDKSLIRMHAPGSPFKTLIALTALQENVISKNDNIFCSGNYIYGKNRRKMKCHCGGGYRNLYSAISNSCNSYFAIAFRKTIGKYENSSKSMDIWNRHITSFGLGKFLGNDLSVGKKGNIPDGKYYDEWYPDFRWGPTTILSNAIGQGEILVTPIQLANMTAAIANRGFYFTPHIIKSIEGDTIEKKFKTKINTTIDSKYFDPVIEGMARVYTNGTASFLKIPEIDVCGKTGTAENFTKINGKKTQLTDHSIFIAFAPKNNPKIAVSVLVENGYYGSRWAGRIASLMIEKYLKGKITLKNMEELVLNKSLEEEYIKPYINESFNINQ